MIRLNSQQTEWLQNIYNTAFRASQDNRFSLRLATRIYSDTRFNPSFELPDGSMAGIAGLPSDLEGVDINNPQESIEYVVQSTLDDFIAADGDLDSIIELDETVAEVESHFDQELFGSTTTFTDIDDTDSRFKRAMASNNTDELGTIIDELVSDRVNQRNRVINNDA